VLETLLPHDDRDDADSDSEAAIDPRIYNGWWQRVTHWRGPVPGLRRANTPMSIAVTSMLLAASIAVELYLATIGIMLSVDATNTTWLVFVTTTPRGQRDRNRPQMSSAGGQ
jgi:hypothetical protein